MSTHVLLTEIAEPALGVAAACLNLVTAFALVIVSLLLVTAVASVAWLCDHPNELRPVRCRTESVARR